MGINDAIIAENGDCSQEIRTQLGIARTVVKSLNSFCQDRSMNMTVKQRLVSTLAW